MLEHRAPFDQIAGALHIESTDRPDLRVVAVTHVGYLLLQGEPGDTRLQDALLQQIGVQLPRPQTTRIRGAYALLWMTPKEWLLELPETKVLAVQAALATRLAQTHAAITDASDSFACFDVSGERTAEALMAGCSLDLRPHVFAPGCVARTAIADVPAIVWKLGIPSAIRCLVDRSFAAHFWNWLARSPAKK